MLDPEQLKTFFADSLRVIETIAELCRPQWQDRGMTYEAFADLIIADESTFLAASQAFANAIADFFRRIGRPAMGAVVDRAWEAVKVHEEIAVEKANGPKIGNLLETMRVKLDRDFDEAIERAHAEIRGDKSGGLPAS
jgi:hypothetical protein